MIVLKFNPSHRYFLPVGKNLHDSHRGYAIGGLQWNVFKKWIKAFAIATETGSTLSAEIPGTPSTLAYRNAQARAVGTVIYSTGGLASLWSLGNNDVHSFNPSTEGTPVVALTDWINTVSEAVWGAACSNSAHRFYQNCGSGVVET